MSSTDPSIITGEEMDGLMEAALLDEQWKPEKIYSGDISNNEVISNEQIKIGFSEMHVTYPDVENLCRPETGHHRELSLSPKREESDSYPSAEGIIVEHFNNFDVRIIDKDGNPWFLAGDICEVLGLSNVGQMLTRLDETEKDDIIINDVIGRRQKQRIVNESGLYSLIFSSTKPDAKKFKMWVTSEVIPSIRKNGYYGKAPKSFAEALRLAADQAEKIEKLEQQHKLEQPKAEYFDKLVYVGCNLNFRDSAKEMGIKQKVFIQWLEDRKFIYRTEKGKIRPYAENVDKYFVMKEFIANQGSYADSQTRITPEGRQAFMLMLKADGLLGQSE
jgi:prophage antirepressor-like protein